MLLYWIWYAELKLSGHIKNRLLEHFPTPEDIYHADEETLAAALGLTPQELNPLEDKDLGPARRIVQSCRQKNIGILTPTDALYPEKLRNLTDLPLVLYYRGQLPALDEQPVIGVVGTRKATAYGLSTARRMGAELSACGTLVVSGGASGIDTLALEGVLEVDGSPVAVLGCGVDVVYPRNNKDLFRRIEEKGCLISEYPPETPALSWNFPRRNRIISGLSDGVLVVEAPEKSGALITAERAMEQGRELFVIPGNIDQKTCSGSNGLLRRGGIPVLEGWDIAREYENRYPGVLCRKTVTLSDLPVREQIPSETAVFLRQKPASLEGTDKKGIDNGTDSSYSVPEKPLPSLTETEQAVLALVTREPVSMDAVIAESQMNSGTVLSALTTLSMKGVIRSLPGRRVSLK